MESAAARRAKPRDPRLLRWRSRRAWSGIGASGELGVLPPPLAGEGWGGGERVHMYLCAGRIELLHAPPPSLPRKRGGECHESAALGACSRPNTPSPRPTK